MPPQMINQRKVNYAIDPLFPNRWSPRALSGDQVTREELFSLFEAARWAPSSFNGQPWRFLYAMRDTPAWKTLFDLLIDFNQAWAKNAAVLVVVASRKRFEHNEKPNKTHSFDTGAAWENLALQGSHKGLVVHGMSGFDYDKAREVLHVPEDYQVEAMIAIGKPGKKEDLPLDLQEREQPSERKKVEEFVFEGVFHS